MIYLTINGQDMELDVPLETPLLWVLRDHLNLTGTKYGYGIGHCGACTVHLNGKAAKSCMRTISQSANAEIVTIEGVSEEGLHPVQQAWIDEEVPQCGYCQSGQIMAATALLDQKPRPTDEEIDAAMTNICRCGSYVRIRKAIHKVARERAAQ
ncbi:MAG TPA: (2Fe-2S)-binding protein [Gammaproteobacteria bacterium]|nr:(2Fe-2S)-binding protein [Gammaproteobacteria bacterium]